jgi:hypothetical protein
MREVLREGTTLHDRKHPFNFWVGNGTTNPQGAVN